MAKTYSAMMKSLAEILFKLLEFLLLLEQICRMSLISKIAPKNKEEGTDCCEYFLYAPIDCELNSVEVITTFRKIKLLNIFEICSGPVNMFPLCLIF